MPHLFASPSAKTLIRSGLTLALALGSVSLLSPYANAQGYGSPSNYPYASRENVGPDPLRSGAYGQGAGYDARPGEVGGDAGPRRAPRAAKDAVRPAPKQVKEVKPGDGKDAGKPALENKSAEGKEPKQGDTRRNVTRSINAAGSGRDVAGSVKTAHERLVADEVVIEVAPGMSQEQIDQLAKRHGLTRIVSQDFKMTGSTFFRWRIPDGRAVSAVIRQLEQDPVVLSAQPNHVYSLQQQTASRGSGPEMVQYVAGKLRLSEAHRLARGDNILVAVIDSGIDASHPDLDGLVLGRFDAFDGDKVKAHAHGTGIAGAIAAHGRIIGVAPGVRILAARAFGGPNGTQSESFKILQALEWSINSGAKIINMSFAGPHDRNLERALNEARRRGIVLVAAAGNAGPKSAPLFPAMHPEVIAVTAVDAEDKLFAASNRGDHIVIAAPGVDILLPSPRSSYQVTSGTSFAAAHVTGVIALMLQLQPGLDPDEVKRLLIGTARDLGAKGRDPDFGAGLVDAFRVLDSIEQARKATADRGPAR